MQRVSATTRHLCAFGGGEEFGVLRPRYDRDQAMELAEQLREAIADVVIEVPSGTLRVTASLACATLDETEGSIEALIALADKRLYSAKRAGRNRVFAPETKAV